jgi:hypothetical protein
MTPAELDGWITWLSTAPIPSAVFEEEITDTDAIWMTWLDEAPLPPDIKVSDITIMTPYPGYLKT